MQRRLKVLTDYTENPGPRYIDQAPYSGEHFYISLLNKTFAECLKAGDTLLVDLDGTSGYPSSFLDESFGELVYDFGLDVVLEKVTIVSLRKKWKRMVETETYPEWEQRRKDGKEPLMTEECEVYALDKNGRLVIVRRTKCH